MARRRRPTPRRPSICPAWMGSERRLRTAVDELIELLSLEAYRSKLIRELSTGTRRVVDLACVVAHRPSVVLLDEPSSGIAQRESEALGPLLIRIRDMLGAGLVVIEHDMPLLAGVADRLIALDQGSLLVEGTPDAVLRDPLVIASYLGENATAIARSDTVPGPTARSRLLSVAADQPGRRRVGTVRADAPGEETMSQLRSPRWSRPVP